MHHAKSIEHAEGKEEVLHSRDKLRSLVACECPITLGWDITLKVPLLQTKKKGMCFRGKSKTGDITPKEKTILDHIAGQAMPYQLVAIMGASGAGKTSLLNCLARRNKRFTGQVFVNGEPAADSLSSLSGFVQQEDLFIPTLTVREQLMFQAILRMDRTLSKPEREQKVNEIVLALSLTKCLDTLVGGANSLLKGISGGELKRLSFATEVLFNPSLLFCDEPTSGLDSFMAEEVVREMRKIADSGRTVIGTIHQPSSQVFEMFTHLILLAGSGRLAYLGRREEAVRYLSGIGYDCPTYFNPADYFIHLLAILPEDRDGGASLKRVEKVVDAYDQSDLCVRNREFLTTNSTIDIERGTTVKDLLRNAVNNKASWGTQFQQLYKRTGIMYKRDPVLGRVRMIQSVIVSLLVGLIYLRLGNTQTDVQNKMGAAFFLVINQCFSGMLGVLQVFPLEKPIFYREYQSGTYRVDAYFLARTLCEIPIQFTFPIIFGTISWWLIGFNDRADRFFLFLFLLVTAGNAAISLGYIVSAVAPNVTAAMAIGTVMLFPLLIFGGLLINTSSIPKYFWWLDVFSFFKYGYTAINVLIWKDYKLKCPQTGVCRFKSGEDVLQYLNVSDSMNTYWYNMLYLAVLVVGFRFLAYLILLRKAKQYVAGGGH